jgi:uncharacterized protein involved in exopolysaccharide biosynthesis
MDELRNADVETEAWEQMHESAEERGKSIEDLMETVLFLLRGYWKRRVIALSIIFAGAVLSIAYAWSLHNYYTSTATLMPPDNSSPYSTMLGMLGGSGASVALGSDAFGLSTPGDLLASILESRTVGDAMIQHYGLVRYYNVKVPEDARGSLRRATTIDQDRKSGIISISVIDQNPEFARKLAQGYVTELNNVLMRNSTSAARRERMFLEERLKEVKKDLDESSMALSQFSTKTKAIDITSQARSMIEASLRIQGSLAESESQLAALKQTYSEDNNRVKALEARNAELRRQYNAIGGVTKRPASTANGNTSYPSVGDLPTLGLTYADLERKVRVDEALWEALTKQYEMARVQEAKEIPSTTVLDNAYVPVRKTGPKRTILVLTATFFSFLFSYLVVFVLEYWEKVGDDSLLKKFIIGVLEIVRRKPQEHGVGKA